MEHRGQIHRQVQPFMYIARRCSVQGPENKPSLTARVVSRSNASTSVGVQRGVNESDVRELSLRLTQLFNKGLGACFATSPKSDWP